MSMEQDAPLFFSTPYPELNAILEQVYRHRGADGRGSLRQLSEAVDKLTEKWAAARAPADSVTAPAGGVADGWKWAPEEPTLHMGWAYLDAARESDPLRTHTFNHAGYRAMLAAAPTPPAQAADSVLEDAALSPEEADLLEKAISDFEESGETDVPDAVLRRFAEAGYLECVHYHVMPTARDAIDAARKQGANHD